MSGFPVTPNLPSTRLPNPRYDERGELVCGMCGKPLARASNKFMDSVASCSDTACEAHARIFEEGSFRHNPHRERLVK
jgi:hypothetical protein